VTIGGFHTDGITSGEPVSIARVIFRVKDGVGGMCHFDLGNLTDDLAGAGVTKGELTVSSMPGEYQLSQNYPNPFNPETTIEFYLPTSSDVTVSVYNVLGQVVDVLVDNVLEPGYHHIKWDAAKFSSGVYYYCLSAGNFKVTRKMMLLR
jgi:hypothetical protein